MVRLGSRMSMGNPAAKRRGMSGRAVEDSLVVLLSLAMVMAGAAPQSGPAAGARAEEGAEPALAIETLTLQEIVLRGPEADPEQRIGVEAARAEAMKAKQSVYEMTLRQLQNFIDTPGTTGETVGLALDEAIGAYRDWRGANAAMPLEVSLLRAEIDQSMASIGTTIAVSPDGTRVATTTEPLERTRTPHIALWDISSGRELAVIQKKRFRPDTAAVTFSPDGNHLAVGDTLVDAATGELLWQREGLSGESSVAFSPDGTRLAIGGWNALTDDEGKKFRQSTVVVRDRISGDSLATFAGARDYGGNVTVAFSPDGKWLVADGLMRSVKNTGNRTALLDLSTVREMDLPEGEDGALASVAFNADGSRMVAIAQGDQGSSRVCLLDGATGERLWSVQGGASFSPDGSWLVVQGIEKGDEGENTKTFFRLVDPATGKPLWTIQGAYSIGTFSPDGSRLLVKDYGKRDDGDNDESCLRLMDAATGNEIWSIPVDREEIYPITLRFSPDGSRIAGQGSCGTLIDAATGKILAAFKSKEPASGHVVSGLPMEKSAVAFSPDGSRLVMAAKLGAVLYDAATGAEVVVLAAPDRAIRSFAFSPDGSLLATTALRGEGTSLWDASTGKSLGVVAGDRPVAFSPDGDRLATLTMTDELRLWGTSTLQALAGFRRVPKKHGWGNQKAPPVTFSRDGRRLLTDDQIWDVSTGIESTVIAISPDGTRVATGEGRTVRLSDAVTGESLALLDAGGSEVVSIVFSPDGTRVTTSCIPAPSGSGSTMMPARSGAIEGAEPTEAEARYWDAATGRQLAAVKGEAASAEALAFSPDGSRLATARYGCVRLWDVATGKELAALGKSPRGPPPLGSAPHWPRLLFSPDGNQLIICSVYRSQSAKCPTVTAVLYDVSTGSELTVLKTAGSSIIAAIGTTDGVVAAEAFRRLPDVRNARSFPFPSRPIPLRASPDAANNPGETVPFLDAATWGGLAVLENRWGIRGGSVSWSPDGSRIATCGFDENRGDAFLWDAATGKILAILGNPTGGYESLAFSSDGSYLALIDRRANDNGYGGFDNGMGRVRLWGISNAEIQAKRLAAPAIRERLAPVVAEWFSGDSGDAAVSERLAAAKGTMPADDWREAANLVLMESRLRGEER